LHPLTPGLHPCLVPRTGRARLTVLPTRSRSVNRHTRTLRPINQFLLHVATIHQVLLHLPPRTHLDLSTQRGALTLVASAVTHRHTHHHATGCVGGELKVVRRQNRSTAGFHPTGIRIGRRNTGLTLPRRLARRACLGL